MDNVAVSKLRFNHLAIAVNSVAEAGAVFHVTFGIAPSEPVSLPEHGVRVVFLELANTQIELMEPMGDASPIKKFLQRNPQGGIHHFCMEVPDLTDIVARAEHLGMRLLGKSGPEIGAHGNEVVFFHPKDLFGALIELEQVATADDAHQSR